METMTMIETETEPKAEPKPKREAVEQAPPLERGAFEDWQIPACVLDY